MDPEFILAMIFILTLTSILMGTIIVVAKAILQFKQKKLEITSGQTGIGSEANGHIQQMEERLQVLERVATENGADLSHEIEAPRLANQVEEQAQEKAL